MKQFATVKAAIRDPVGGKTRYVLVGRAMRDGDQIAVVLDTLPREQVNWTGWLNLFPLDAPKTNDSNATPVRLRRRRHPLLTSRPASC